MIKPNDVRIGNYFECGKIGKVNSIFKTYFTIEDEHGIQLGNSIEHNIKPIIITKEIFNKMDKVTLGKVLSYNFDLLNKSYGLRVFIEDQILCITYVHQLQNIFHSLTLKEFFIDLN